jgi:hypothetical protein
MSHQSDSGIPILTDVVGEEEPSQWPSEVDTLVAELQTRLAAEAFALTEEIMRQAFSEMEATLLQQISTKLRQALPELIDAVLRERLETQTQESKDST